MNRPIVTSLLGLAIAAASLWDAPAVVAARSKIAQSPATRTSAPPRTADRHPDFHGYWTNDTFTPLERPEELADKPFFTEAEAASELKKRLDRYLAQPKNDIHYDDAIWQAENYYEGSEPPHVPDCRSSQRQDPAADGRGGKAHGVSGRRAKSGPGRWRREPVVG